MWVRIKLDKVTQKMENVYQITLQIRGHIYHMSSYLQLDLVIYFICLHSM